MTFQKGQRIVIAYGDRRFPGIIELASANGVSLAVRFDGMIGGWVGGAALLYPHDATDLSHYVTLDGLRVAVYPDAEDES